MTRILIVVFDALRPEFVTPDLMPHLHAFARQGVHCANHHSTFPTETRVNQSSVVTGCYPHRHGVVANNFPLPGSSEIVKTGDDLALEAMLSRMDTPLLGVPTLGQTLAGHGLSYASISAGTSGGGRLINLHAVEIGSQRYALRRPEVSVPEGLADRIAARIGPIPDYQRPAVAWNRHAADAWLEVMDPAAPDVSLLWLCEPDETFHWHGIGSPEALEAIRGVDAAFGAILSRKADALAAGELQIIALSDHGQISLSGEKLDLVERMQVAGFSLDGDAPDYLVSVHNAGGIWIRDHDPDLIARMTRWLAEQPFIGPVFTRDGLPGTLPHAEIRADHPRAPDIYLALAHTDGANAHGIAGLSADNAPYPSGGGCHGGLSRYELHNFLALGGTAFGRNQPNAAPTGNVDILPTVLHLLGLPVPDHLDGRILAETLAEPGPKPPPLTRTLGDTRTRLSVSDVGNTRYLDRAWVELSHP